MSLLSRFRCVFISCIHGKPFLPPEHRGHQGLEAAGELWAHSENTPTDLEKTDDRKAALDA